MTPDDARRADMFLREWRGEPLEKLLVRHRSVLGFSKNWVVKMYDDAKDATALRRSVSLELAWDRAQPRLDAEVTTGWRPQGKQGSFTCLLQRRLPVTTCLATHIAADTITGDSIHVVVRHIERISLGRPHSAARASTLARDFVANTLYQLRALEHIVESRTSAAIRRIVLDNRGLTHAAVASVKRRRVRLCHGNMFSTNIFLLGPDEIVTIDPATTRLWARRLDVCGDLATLCADVLLSGSARARSLMMAAAVASPLTSTDLFPLYVMLKAAVRLRFAAAEDRDAVFPEHIVLRDRALASADVVLARLVRGLQRRSRGLEWIFDA